VNTSAFLNTFSLVVILTSDLLTSKYNQLISVPKTYQQCKFGQIFPSTLQDIMFTSYRDSHTDGPKA